MLGPARARFLGTELIGIGIARSRKALGEHAWRCGGIAATDATRVRTSVDAPRLIYISTQKHREEKKTQKRSRINRHTQAAIDFFLFMSIFLRPWLVWLVSRCKGKNPTGDEQVHTSERRVGGDGGLVGTPNPKTKPTKKFTTNHDHVTLHVSPQSTTRAFPRYCCPTPPTHPCLYARRRRPNPLTAAPTSSSSVGHCRFYAPCTRKKQRERKKQNMSSL